MTTTQKAPKINAWVVYFWFSNFTECISPAWKEMCSWRFGVFLLIPINLSRVILNWNATPKEQDIPLEFLELVSPCSKVEPKLYRINYCFLVFIFKAKCYPSEIFVTLKQSDKTCFFVLFVHNDVGSCYNLYSTSLINEAFKTIV